MRPDLPLALPTWTEACARRIIAEGPRSKNRSTEAQAARAEVIKMLSLVRCIPSGHLRSAALFPISASFQKLVRWGGDAKGTGNLWPARMMPVQALPAHLRREVCAPATQPSASLDSNAYPLLWDVSGHGLPTCGVVQACLVLPGR